jgi:eukaryotic-like serine/threonine-protein kinase
MTSEQWLQVKEAFDHTRALSAELRERAVAEIADEEVRNEVEELVKAFDRSPEFLERPAILNEPFASAATSVSGQRLGNHMLVRRIGEGGMGIVYEAHRADGEFEQRVAVKLVRCWLTSNRESSDSGPSGES